MIRALQGFSLDLLNKNDVAKFLRIGYEINELTLIEEVLNNLNEILSEIKKRNDIIMKML